MVMNDPLGLSPEQRAQSDRSARIDEFVKRYGSQIQLAVDGTWYVEENGQMITLALPKFPAWPEEIDTEN